MDENEEERFAQGRFAPLPEDPQEAREARLRKQVVYGAKAFLFDALTGMDANPGRTLHLVRAYASMTNELLAELGDAAGTGKKGRAFLGEDAGAYGHAPLVRNPLGVEADRLMRAQRVQALSRSIESARETGDVRVETWAQTELASIMGPASDALGGLRVQPAEARDADFEEA